MYKLVQNCLQFSEKSFLCGDDDTAKPKLYNECVPYIDDESVFGWCSTRSYFNDSSMVGHYGNCDPGCRSQVYTGNYSFYNLASSAHGHLWGEHIFKLGTESSGHCHTYNPVNESFAENRGQFYALLGKTLFFKVLDMFK